MPRWVEVEYGWGFLKVGAAGTDTVPNMMVDYEAEIDRLKAGLEEANTIANDNYQVILKCNGHIDDLKHQLAEARADNEALIKDLGRANKALQIGGTRHV